MYLVFISIIFQPNLILVTGPIAPVTRNSTCEYMTKIVNHFSMLIVGIYMGISLVKFVIPIFSGYMTNILINQQLFTQKTIPKRPLYQMFFMADPSVPSGL